MVIVSDILLPKNADGILKVSDVSTSADSDLSARTDIADPTTSTFVKTDATGRLNILESNIEGVGADNSLNATQYAVKQVGAFDGTAFRSVKCSNVGRLEVDINSGGGSVALKAGNDSNNNMAAVGVFGSINGTADYRSIQVDSAGALLVRADNSNDSIRIVGQNSVGANKGVGVEDTNGGILSAGKVVVADPTSADGSRQLLRLNAKHELLVNNSKITQGEADVAGGGNGLQQILCYGKDQSGNLDPLNVDNNGHLKITLNDIEAGIVNPINVASKHANAYLEIMTGSSVTIGNNILTSAHTLSAGASTSGGMVKPVTIYVHFGAGTSDSNFTVEVHKSYDGVVYFVDTNFTFSPVGSNTNSPPTVEPAMVANGNSDGRFIKVKITNNSEANPTSVDVIVIERQ